MEKTASTKELLAATLKRLSAEIPLRRISVQKLSWESGINRGTFYYHFRDVQDLINWIYHSEITLPVHDYIANSRDPQLQISSFVLERLYRDKGFYMQAMAMEGPNCLEEYMLQQTQTNWDLLLQRVLRDTQIRQEALAPSVEEALKSTMLYFCYGHYFATRQWIRDGMKTAPEVFARMLDTAAGKGLFAMLEQTLQNPVESGQYI